MRFKSVMFIWILFLALLSYEYYGLNFNESLSLLKKLQAMGYLPARYQINKEPGRQLSLFLGWTGLGLMIMMNVYSLRKRLSWLSHSGKLTSWLNFHILCGLIGPTFILFHCNFKVRGVVGISFWSMVISFSSGLIGRYFYIQMLQAKKEFEKEAEQRLAKIGRMLARINVPFTQQDQELYSKKALQLAGAPLTDTPYNPLKALVYSMAGDIRMAFTEPEIGPQWPTATKFILKDYAVNKRRSALLAPFQRLMGYWHAFHFPFAIFMYVAAIIHVTAALMFGV
ncbi:MAG TPA: hypothetical protein VIG33_00540 [Pseudobdellovibrionaceae bacterium]